MPYFKFWILIFSRGNNMQNDTLSWYWAMGNGHKGPSQLYDHEGKQSIRSNVVLNASFLYNIFTLQMGVSGHKPITSLEAYV